MTIRRRHRSALSSLVASALALAAVLHGGDALADARTEARRHFKSGMQLVAQKRFVDGIRELEKAYEIAPHPNVAFNIAQAQAEGGSLDLAVKAYKTYLASDPPDREEVQKIMAQLQEKIAAQKAAEQAAKEPKPPEPPPPELKPGDLKPAEVKPSEPSNAAAHLGAIDNKIGVYTAKLEAAGLDFERAATG